MKKFALIFAICTATSFGQNNLKQQTQAQSLSQYVAPFKANAQKALDLTKTRDAETESYAFAVQRKIDAANRSKLVLSREQKAELEDAMVYYELSTIGQAEARLQFDASFSELTTQAFEFTLKEIASAKSAAEGNKAVKESRELVEWIEGSRKQVYPNRNSDTESKRLRAEVNRILSTKK